MRPFLLRTMLVMRNILFPPLCIHCETYLNDHPFPLCESCYASIAKLTALHCPICGVRTAKNRKTCTHGKNHMRQFPYLIGATSLYDDPVIKRCIHACKYQKLRSVTETLSRLLVEYATQLNPQPTIYAQNPIVIPIPIHAHKERTRGFNQSALLARSFAHAMQFRYEESLVKIEDADPQAQTKTRQERFERMRGAFAVPCSKAVKNKNIILIDDVSTSGATLSEAAQTLKAAGAKQILALVIARA